MFRTLADLLKKLNLQHRLPLSHPILTLPLFLFKEENYADLITILYLYKEEWIEESKAPKPGTVLGEISYRHVKQFYDAIKSEITRALTTPQDSACLERKESVEHLNVEESLQIRSKPNKWVNASQVMLFMNDNPIYEKLVLWNDFPHECVFFLKWINSERISAFEQECFIGKIQDLKANNELEDNINDFAVRLTHTDLLRSNQESHLYPQIQSLIFHYIIRINKQKELRTNCQYVPELLDYLHLTLIAASRQYPATLEILFLSMHIKIPETLTPDLVHLLKVDLRTLPNLTEEQWPELLYYASLFLFGLAKAEPFLARFTYSADDLAIKLKLAQADCRYLHIYKHGLHEEFINLKFAAYLKTSMSFNNLDIQPRVFSLLCLNNCPLLKELFINIWKGQGKEVPEQSTIALISSTNPFLLGKMFIERNTGKKIAINNHDCFLLQQLLTIATNRNSELRSRSLSLGKPETFEIKKAEQKVAHSFPPFFTSMPIKCGAPIVLQDKYQLDFETIKTQIQDPRLRDTLYIGSITTIYSIHFAIDYWAIDQFITEHGVNSATPASFKELQLLFSITLDFHPIDLKIIDLKKHQLFNLNNSSALTRQIHVLNQTVTKIKEILEPLSGSCLNHEALLRVKFLQIEKDIAKRLQKILAHKVLEIEKNKVPKEVGFNEEPRVIVSPT